MRRIKSVPVQLIFFCSLFVFMVPHAWAKTVVLKTEWNEYGSCPFVYSWDGAEYQLDNDIYSVGRGQRGL